MNHPILKIALICFITYSFSDVFSQTNKDTIPQDQTVIVKMKQGDELKGQLIKQDDEKIVMKTQDGEINLIPANVRSIDIYECSGKFEYPNYRDTRYFVGPSAIPLRKGKGYYQNVELVFNFANYGVSQNLSIGGGLELFSTLVGFPIWFLTPKVGFNISETSHAGGGLIIAGSFNSIQLGYLGPFGVGAAAAATLDYLGYGVFTVGTSESNVTLGTIYGKAQGEVGPAIMISGMHRISNNFTLLSENYVSPYEDGTNYFGIHGIRWLFNKNSLDFGAIVIPNKQPSVFPYLGYVRFF